MFLKLLLTGSIFFALSSLVVKYSKSKNNWFDIAIVSVWVISVALIIIGAIGFIWTLPV